MRLVHIFLRQVLNGVILLFQNVAWFLLLTLVSYFREDYIGSRVGYYSCGGGLTL